MFLNDHIFVGDEVEDADADSVKFPVDVEFPVSGRNGREKIPYHQVRRDTLSTIFDIENTRKEKR